MVAASNEYQELYNKIQVLNDYPLNKYIPLVPVTILEASTVMKLAVNLVKLSPNQDDQDVYVREWNKKNVNGKWQNDTPKLLAPARKGLGRLMAAANIQQQETQDVLPSACKRCVMAARETRLAPVCGECENKNDVAKQAAILIPCPDGTFRRSTFTKEIRIAEERDRMTTIENGQPKVSNQFNEMFKFRTEHAESKALNRCVRYALGLKSTYTPEEIAQKTFVVVYPVPNLADPDIKRAVIQRLTGARELLFGDSVPTLALTVGQNIEIPDDGADTEHTTETTTQTSTINQEPEKPTEKPPAPETAKLPDEFCRRCDHIIDDFTNTYGTKKAEDIISYSKRFFGEPYCIECQKTPEVQAKKKQGGTSR
jgi:hypothetical protein